MPFELPDLPYPYDALEPHIDAETMQIHHDAHHKAYVDNANAALAGTEWADRPIEAVLSTGIDVLPEDKQAAGRNNPGGTGSGVVVSDKGYIMVRKISVR